MTTDDYVRCAYWEVMMLRLRICVSGLVALSVAACATGVPSTSESSDDAASGEPSGPAGFTVNVAPHDIDGDIGPNGVTSTNDFSISVSPTSKNVFTNTSVSYTVSTMVTAGSAQTINLSVSGLPCGVTASFSPKSVTAGGSSTLTLTFAPDAACTGATFTVTGTGTDATHTASASFTVIGCVAFDIDCSPTSQTVNAGSSGVYSVITNQTSCLVQNIQLSESGMPVGITGSFNPATVIAGGRSTLTLTAASTAPASTATFTVTGTSRSETHTASASVTVAAACINSMFNSTDVPKSIPDNNATGITSTNSVTGSGTVSSLSLSLNITHTFIGDLVVTLISPGGTQFVVWNRQGGSADNLVINNMSITAFNSNLAAGTWKLKVQDLAAQDVGTLNSWSLNIVDNCGA